MNTKQLSERIGQLADLQTNSLLVRVKILDAKVIYGCVRFLVSPVTGSGEVWVDTSRLAEVQL